MKFSNKTYAKVLLELIFDKKDVNDKKIVDNFIKLLQKNKDFRRAKQIIQLTEKLYREKSGKNKVILETARKVNYKEITDKIIKDKDIVEEKINPDLIAGIKIILNDERQLDFSLKNKLEKVFN